MIKMCCIDEEYEIYFKTFLFIFLQTKGCLAMFLFSCLTLPWEVCRNFEIQAAVCFEKKNPSQAHRLNFSITSGSLL